MYENLIKKLRNRRICIQSGGSLTEDFPLMREAADAIEELQEDNAALNGTVTNLLEQIKDLGKPKWIPVKERLPEEPGRYLVCKRWDYGYGTYHSMSVVSFTDNLNKVDNYDFHGKKYKRPGWFDYDSEYGHFETGDDIIAWMPLPTPPKEAK